MPALRCRKPRTRHNGARALSFEQYVALKEYADRHGRAWKSALRKAWMSSGNLGAELQSIRNQFGPSWLTRFSFASHTTRANGRSASKYRTKAEVMRAFREEIAPNLRHKDRAAIAEAWSLHLDYLYGEGEIPKRALDWTGVWNDPDAWYKSAWARGLRR